MLLFGTNNYLGATFDSGCIDDGVDALRAHGTGTTGSRIANGSYDAHVALERKIAGFLGYGDAMVFTETTTCCWMPIATRASTTAPSSPARPSPASATTTRTTCAAASASFRGARAAS